MLETTFQDHKNIYGSHSASSSTSTPDLGKRKGKMKAYIYQTIGKSKSSNSELDRHLNTNYTSSCLLEELCNFHILISWKNKEKPFPFYQKYLLIF